MGIQPSGTPAIECHNVTKTFMPSRGIAGIFGHSSLRQPITAVDNLSLQVEKGEIFGLLGPNGAGKTTLIKMLCTLIVPTSGTALVNGYDVVRKEQLARSSIGMVSSEERSFYWRLTGRQNLEFFAALHGLRGKPMDQRIDELLDLMDLSYAADEMFQTYSTGMKQKMCIARGLLTDPAVLFLDEPTRSLDPIAAESVRRFVKEELVAGQGRTVVLTTHRLEEAARTCDRIAIMNHGRVVACGTLDGLRSVLKSICRYEIRIAGMSKGLHGRLNSIEAAEDMEIICSGREPVHVQFRCSRDDSALPEVLRAIIESGADVIDCRAEEVSLEEVFSHFTIGEGSTADVPKAAGVS